MTDEEFREAAWRAVSVRVSDLARALAAATDIPMDDREHLVLQESLMILDRTRSVFETALAKRLVAAGWQPSVLSLPPIPGR